MTSPQKGETAGMDIDGVKSSNGVTEQPTTSGGEASTNLGASSEDAASSNRSNRLKAELTQAILMGDNQAFSHRIQDTLFAGPGHEDAQREAHNILIPASYATDRAHLAQAQDVMNLLVEQRRLMENEQPFTVEISVLEQHKAAMQGIVAYYELRRGRAEEEAQMWKGYEMIRDLAHRAWNGCLYMVYGLSEPEEGESSD